MYWMKSDAILVKLTLPKNKHWITFVLTHIR